MDFFPVPSNFNCVELLFICIPQVPLSRAAWFVRVTMQGSIGKELQSSRSNGSVQHVLQVTRKQWCSDMASELCQSFAGGMLPNQRNGNMNYGTTPPYGRESPASQVSTPNDSMLTPNPHEYSNSPEGGGGLGSTNGFTHSLQHGRWQQTYLVLLARRLYEDGITDRCDWLLWLASALVDKKLRSHRDIVLHLVLQYIGEFAKSYKICVVLYNNLQQLQRETSSVQCSTAAASAVQQRVHHATLHLLAWIVTECPDILCDQDAKHTSAWLHPRGSDPAEFPSGGLLTPAVMQRLETSCQLARERRVAVAALTGDMQATHGSLCFLVECSAASVGRFPMPDSVAMMKHRCPSPQGQASWRLHHLKVRVF